MILLIYNYFKLKYQPLSLKTYNNSVLTIFSTDFYYQLENKEAKNELSF